MVVFPDPESECALFYQNRLIALRFVHWKRPGRGQLLSATVPGVELPADLARYRAHHHGVLREHTRLLPGALDAVRALKRRGKLTAVCSNKPRGFTRELLDFLGLAPHIDALFG